MDTELTPIPQAPSNQDAQVNTIGKSVITSDAARVKWEKAKNFLNDIQTRMDNHLNKQANKINQ